MNAVVFIIAIVMAMFVPQILGAYALNKRLHRIHPNFKPFVWGYFNALSCFLAPFYAVGAMIGENPELSGSSGWYLVLIAVFVIIFFPLGVLALKRSRWAFVAITILSMNPLIWILNGFYLRNRWRELKFNKGDDNEANEADTSKLVKASAGGMVTTVARTAGKIAAHGANHVDTFKEAFKDGRNK